MCNGTRPCNAINTLLMNDEFSISIFPLQYINTEEGGESGEAVVEGRWQAVGCGGGWLGGAVEVAVRV